MNVNLQAYLGGSLLDLLGGSSLLGSGGLLSNNALLLLLLFLLLAVLGLLGGSGLLGGGGGGGLFNSGVLLLLGSNRLLGLGLLLGQLGASRGTLGLGEEALFNTGLEGLVEERIEHVVRNVQSVVGLDILLQRLTAAGAC